MVIVKYIITIFVIIATSLQKIYDLLFCEVNLCTMNF